MAGGGETHRMHEKLSARTRKSIDEIAAEASAKHAAAVTARSAMAAEELTRRRVVEHVVQVALLPWRARRSRHGDDDTRRGSYTDDIERNLAAKPPRTGHLVRVTSNVGVYCRV